MMNNLFSIFDPTAILLIPINWISMFMFILMFLPSYWILSNPMKTFIKKIIFVMNNEFSTLLKNNKINIILFISLFMLILFNNTLGLFSFTFTATSHLAITLALALPLWLTFILYSLTNNLTNFLAHLVPSGTPPVLMPFMVLIELVSNVIRPITLSVRLAANMIAGHLLLSLLETQLATSSWILLPMIGVVQYLLLMLESAVAYIQAYVFSVLTTLYASEA
uniref:ATP synthase subunit a n=1 Tax=Cypridopsis vidua TaxID=230730 RepID=A0A0N7ATG0_9CRUS|nr:ATP synthase F0 subunit 6 [Cypridopsis vidua]AJY78604.1 ATP synthase F0 subunit 6 [Cypridopsis vidua]